MSILTLQFGQCGNQLGESLYSTLKEDIESRFNQNGASDFYSQAVNTWFNIDNNGIMKPRSILIDTEVKVVRKLQHSSVQFDRVVVKKLNGSANNWAFGYMENGKLLLDEILDSVRDVLEKSDFLTTFLNLYSVAGGTGSGVGSYIIEKLRDEYPKKTMINCAILPYTGGEVPTQAYNCLLNLSKLYSVGDCTILFENEKLMHLCRYNLGLDDVCFSNINSIISQQLVSLLHPVPNGHSSYFIQHLTANQFFKFLQVKTEPFFKKGNLQFETVQKWINLINTLMKEYHFETQQYRESKCDFHKKVISNVLVTRGSEPLPLNIARNIKHPTDFVSWLPQEERLKIYSETTPFSSFDKFCTRLYNSNNVVVPLDIFVNDAWVSFTYGAYLHHYQQYGVDSEYFLECFQTLENILHRYKCI